jgi:hypothetical protein
MAVIKSNNTSFDIPQENGHKMGNLKAPVLEERNEQTKARNPKTFQHYIQANSMPLG